MYNPYYLGVLIYALGRLDLRRQNLPLVVEVDDDDHRIVLKLMVSPGPKTSQTVSRQGFWVLKGFMPSVWLSFRSIKTPISILSKMSPRLRFTNLRYSIAFCGQKNKAKSSATYYHIGWEINPKLCLKLKSLLGSLRLKLLLKNIQPMKVT